MQHLNEDHLGITEPIVYLVVSEGITPPFDFQSFHDFPRQKGWVIDSNDYSLDVLPPGDTKSTTVFEPRISSFLQAWLFFGLIFTIVQEDGEPLIKYDELRQGDQVTTKVLQEKLARWVEWERENKKGQLLRMIRYEKVLDLARRVVRRNLGWFDPPTHTYATLLGGGNDALYVDDAVILSIMVLGETLCDTKSKISQDMNIELRGWYNEDDSGWGPPQWVMDKMEEDKWCPRAVHLLRGQLRSKATLLLAAYNVRTVSNSSPLHKELGCDTRVCKVTPESTNKTGKYEQTHCKGFCSPRDCELYPETNMQEISGYLEKGKRPLLQFRDTENGSVHLDVVEWEHQDMPKEYATISHVWSDGFGNPEANTLLLCQLKFIRHQLQRLGTTKDMASKPSELPFWMDTLLVPVGPEKHTKKFRRRAIQQIPQTFKDSTYTIVIDFGLASTDPVESRPAQTAMKIIASSWMRRLWTLQEAFLSKRLYVAFNHNDKKLKYFDDLCKELEGKRDGPTSALITTVKKQLQNHIMDEDRVTPDKISLRDSPDLPPSKAAVLIVNAWKAARWRTTSNELHETLALASLLDLEFKGTRIEDVGLAPPEKVKSGDAKAMRARNKEKDELMKMFWTIFDRRWPDSIPPGIIFLPGDRVQIPGYGWSPRTWLSAHEVDFPDPLSLVDSTAELDTRDDSPPRGLKVRYPGFRLYAENRHIFFSTDKQHKAFYFPVNQHLQEWYKVEATDNDSGDLFLQKTRSGNNPLAIILSRERPQEFPPEIGLLVQIYEESKETFQTVYRDRKQGKGKRTEQQHLQVAFEEHKKLVLHCEILHRIKISRDTGSSQRHAYCVESPQNTGSWMPNPGDNNSIGSHYVPDILIPGDDDDKLCVGEVLGSEQIWYVDGFVPNRTQDKGAEREKQQRVVATPSQTKVRQMLQFKQRLPGRTEGTLDNQVVGQGVKRSGTGPVEEGPSHASLSRRKTILKKLTDKAKSFDVRSGK